MPCVRWYSYMAFKKLKNFLSTSFYNETALSQEFISKNYGEKVEIKNSIKWNLLYFFGMLILAIVMLKNLINENDYWITVIFCSIIIFAPLIYLLDRRPILILTKDGIQFKNKVFKDWNQITATKIDHSDSNLLIIYFKDNKSKSIGLTDLNYSVGEISHIIEYYKSKNIS